MKQLRWGIILCLILLTGVSEVHAQKKKKKSYPTQTTNTDLDAEIKNPPKPDKEYMYLYLQKSKGTLIGNRCVTEFSEKMGFRYILMPVGQEGSMNVLEQRLNNFGVRFILLFRNGPFWNYRLNKKIKECRKKTGDYVG